VDSPNHKLGMMVCEKSPPLQSTFIAPMQSTQVFSPQLLSSSSIGQFSIPHHVYNNSTQDLSLDLDVEAVKSNLGLDDQSRLRVVMRIIYSVRISLLMMSSWSRILILVANLLIKEIICGDYLLLVVIYVNRRSVQLPVLPPYLVTFAVQLLVNLRKAVVDVGRRMIFLPNMEMIGVLLV
jgi:hypothetical protein